MIYLPPRLESPGTRRVQTEHVSRVRLTSHEDVHEHADEHPHEEDYEPVRVDEDVELVVDDLRLQD